MQQNVRCVQCLTYPQSLCQKQVTSHCGLLPLACISFGLTQRAGRLLNTPARSHPERQSATATEAGTSSGNGTVSCAKHVGYVTLASSHHGELEVKKSRFLTTAWPITSSDQVNGTTATSARQFVQHALRALVFPSLGTCHPIPTSPGLYLSLSPTPAAAQLVERHKDPAARHNCYAFKVGQEYRSSDDGEPVGTAGRPILAAVEAEGLEGVCVLVTRWFGGIKLGAGGLARAYGRAARDCLKAAPRMQVVPQVKMRLEAPHGLVGVLYSTLEQHGGTRLEEAFTPQGNIQLQIQLPAAAAAQLKTAVRDASSGQVQVLDG